MSLYKVHRIMIGTALVFCAGFALRGAVLLFVTRFNGATTAYSAVSAVLAVALAYYLRWLVKNKPSLTEPRPPRRRPRP